MCQPSCDAEASKSLSAPTTIFSYQLINMLTAEEQRPRLSAAERREQMLDAATLVFGELGYFGATTDTIAHAAGVSQAYIVRTFGSKDNLFAETVDRALNKIIATFRTAAEEIAPTRDNAEKVLGKAYITLVSDRSTLLSTMQVFQLGHHPRFGVMARAGMLRIFRLLYDELNLGKPRAEAFLAKGMLINTILSMRLSEEAVTQGDAHDLMECLFEKDTSAVIDITTKTNPFPDKTLRGH